MYIPKAFEEKRIPIMHQMIAAHPLGTLVTLNASGLMASHIPMVVKADGEYGILQAHLSRANPQWQDLVDSIEALAIFAGPQHYISPSWYPAKEEHGKVVPTWNYVVVHAYGKLRVTEDEQWLKAHLQALTSQHESNFERPWQVHDAPEDFIGSLVKGIVGLELPISRLEGKWKVSQNRDEKDRQGVSAGLAQLNTPASLAMKELMDGK